jgi:hypothetical protein
MKVLSGPESSGDISEFSIGIPSHDKVRGYPRDSEFMLIAFPTIDQV